MSHIQTGSTRAEIKEALYQCRHAINGRTYYSTHNLPPDLLPVEAEKSPLSTTRSEALFSQPHLLGIYR